MSAQITENQAVSSRVVKVLKGQKLVVEAFATFDKPEILTEGESLNKTNKVANIAANTAALLSVQDVNIGNESKSKSLNINILAAIPLLKNLFTKARNRHNIRVPLRPKQPKAFLEIAVYSDSLCSEQLYSKQLAISEKSEIFWEKLQDSLVLETDGFAVVSLKNNSDIPVLFDNLELRTYGTQKARIIQENHYEPFGMTLMGLDYVVEDTRGNKFLYNDGTERETSLGLEWDETPFRPYDKNLGRFHGVDALAIKIVGISPFSYCYNNPLKFNDPTGLKPENESWSDLWNRILTNFSSVAQGTYINTNDGGYAYSDAIMLPEVVYEDNTTRTAYKAWNVLNNHLTYRSGVYRPHMPSLDELMTMASLVGGDVITDFYFIGSDLNKGNYGDATISAVATAVPFVNATLAKASLAYIPLAIRALNPANHQIHHIIPKTAYNKLSSYFDNLQNFNIDDALNLVSLPNSFHAKHPAYTGYVTNLIEQRGIINGNNKLTQQDVVNIIQHMEAEIGKAYNSGMRLNEYFK